MIDITWGVNLVGTANYIMMLLHTFLNEEKKTLYRLLSKLKQKV